MEASETREPSYYEVALTNRQVLVAFVILLTCLFAAFLSGVWIGRDAAATTAAASAPAPAAPAPPPVEQLTFFSGKEPGARSAAAAATPAPAAEAPAAAAAETAEDAAAETMRRTLEAEMAAHREAPAATAAAAEVAPAPQPAAGQRARREPAAAPAAAPTSKAAAPTPARTAAAPAAAGSVWIQVYASPNGERAREIAGQLRGAGFAVTLAELDKAGVTQYRVRVGPYPTRASAEQTAGRLRRQQRLDTWVTDSP